MHAHALHACVLKVAAGELSPGVAEKSISKFTALADPSTAQNLESRKTKHVWPWLPQSSPDSGVALAAVAGTKIVTTYYAQGNMVITQEVARITGNVIDVVGSTRRNDGDGEPHWFELNEVRLLRGGQNIAKQATIAYLVPPNRGATSLLTDGMHYGPWFVD